MKAKAYAATQRRQPADTRAWACAVIQKLFEVMAEGPVKFTRNIRQSRKPTSW